MNRPRLLLACLACAVACTDAEPFRAVAIPQSEHGYGGFATTVVRSDEEWRRFIESSAKGAWNDRDAFLKAVAAAKPDFAREALVLIRHDEGSGSTGVTVTPRLRDRALEVTVKREAAEMGTADMAYHAFAFLVDRADVAEVKVVVEGRDPAVVRLGD